VAVAAAAAALVARTAPPGTSEPRAGAIWQTRAEHAERALAATQSRLASLTAQFEALTARYDALSARFDELARRAVPSPEPADAAAAEPPAAATPEFQPVPEEQWEALVSGALQSEIERRFGEALPPERRQRLVDALARVRTAAALMQAEEPEAGAGAGPPQHLTRSIILLEVDRIFREETGIGVGEFLRGLDPEQVEDVPSTAAGGDQER
jgi:hypothetical protein